MEAGFDIQILLGGDNIPRAEMGNQCLDGLVFVPYVVLLEFIYVLRGNVCNDGFDHHRFDHLLESVLLPLNLLVRLELEKLSTVGDVLSSWVDELWFIDTLAV